MSNFVKLPAKHRNNTHHSGKLRANTFLRTSYFSLVALTSYRRRILSYTELFVIVLSSTRWVLRFKTMFWSQHATVQRTLTD